MGGICAAAAFAAQGTHATFTPLLTTALEFRNFEAMAFHSSTYAASAGDFVSFLGFPSAPTRSGGSFPLFARFAWS